MRITLSKEQAYYIIKNIKVRSIQEHLIREVNKNLKIDNSKRVESVKESRRKIVYSKYNKFFKSIHNLYQKDKKITMYAIQKESELSINTVRKYYKECEKIYLLKVEALKLQDDPNKQKLNFDKTNIQSINTIYEEWFDGTKEFPFREGYLAWETIIGMDREQVGPLYVRYNKK